MPNHNSYRIEKILSPGPGRQCHGVLFLKDANKKVRLSLFNASLAFYFMPKQAGRSTFLATSDLRGSALPKFDVKLPAYSIDAYLCGLLKESPMVLPVLFSKG